MELNKGPGAEKAASVLSSTIATKLGSGVRRATPLGMLAEVEVVDIDAAADISEVREAVQVTGLWGTRSGHQVATAKMTKAFAAGLNRVAIGWTMYQGRERRLPSARYYRCHGFGHTRASCTGLDLFGTCRRCEQAGHAKKACTAGDNKCVACEQAGLASSAHRSGSGVCGARRVTLTGRSGSQGPKNVSGATD